MLLAHSFGIFDYFKGQTCLLRSDIESYPLICQGEITISKSIQAPDPVIVANTLQIR